MYRIDLATVVLAAGKGTRMMSDLPKVLHQVAGLPMVRWPVRLAEQIGSSRTVLVVGAGGDRVRAALANNDVVFSDQPEQLGTGHALLCAEPVLAGFAGTILLLCGDVPLLEEGTIQSLLKTHQRQGNAITVLTAELADPRGYGRIVRDGQSVRRIVEDRDAAPEEKKIREVNAGIYAFSAPDVFELLRQVGSNNDQGEYYLTDVVEIALRHEMSIGAVQASTADEILGINDREQLAHCTALLRRRINRGLMLGGVSMIDPETTYIDPNVQVGPDTVIHPGVHLRGQTRVGTQCVIEPGVVIVDCELADQVHVKAGSVLEESKVGSHTDIGPMAHLRPGTELAGKNKIGNFVETKKAVIGLGSKASHLTYLGDADIGAGVNIGCGVITCNYDGERKHRTVIEDSAFVGSDVQLVAPVRVGKGSYIGSGATITRDVPPDSLAISRPEQKNVEGWAKRRREKTGKP